MSRNVYRENKYYEISIFLGSIEAGSYSVYIEGAIDEKEALLKAEEQGIYYGECGCIEYIAEIDEQTFKEGIEILKTKNASTSLEERVADAKNKVTTHGKKKETEKER